MNPQCVAISSTSMTMCNICRTSLTDHQTSHAVNRLWVGVGVCKWFPSDEQAAHGQLEEAIYGHDGGTPLGCCLYFHLDWHSVACWGSQQQMLTRNDNTWICFRSMPVNGPPASKGRPPEAKVLAGCFFTSSVSLQEYGQIPASHYHAKMTPGQRVSVQNRWQSGQLQVIGSCRSAVFCHCVMLVLLHLYLCTP